jgi:muramoyltetrapeptide carboxypeptidase
MNDRPTGKPADRIRLTKLSGAFPGHIGLPPAVRPGDRVGVAALSGAVDPDRLAAGLETLRQLGFEPLVTANLGADTGLFAGDDDHRLAAFHELLAEPRLRAVIFARGGHGLLRLLPRIDWELLARRPLAYVGYSDLTPFLLEVVRRLGVAAFHGPMVAVDLARGLSGDETDSLLGALAGDLPAALPVRCSAGSASCRGRLLGGCLSLLTATLGTPFAPSLNGALLFWEDVDEPLYRLDRMLTQLLLSGSLTGLRGMVVGELRPSDEAPDLQPTLPDILEELARAHDWCVAYGCPSGHCRPNLTLPLGLEARIDAAAGRLVVGEAV